MAADPQFRPADTFCRVIAIIESLRLRYAVGGSVASSIRGIERSTQDMDVLVDLPKERIPELTRAFSGEFYVSEEAIREAVENHRSFNVIHLVHGVKADLFVAGANPLDEPQLANATREEIDPITGATGLVVSAEDIVLVKLDWYRRGRMVSDRQWEDIKNVLKSTPGIRLSYLRDLANRTGLSELLERALSESGRS